MLQLPFELSLMSVFQMSYLWTRSPAFAFNPKFMHQHTRLGAETTAKTQLLYALEKYDGNTRR